MDEQQRTKMQVQFMVNMGIFVPDGVDDSGDPRYKLDLVACYAYDTNLFNVLNEAYGQDFMAKVKLEEVSIFIDEEGYLWYEVEGAND